MDAKAIPWDEVFQALNAWRGALSQEGPSAAPGDPAVTLIAESYSGDPWAILVSTILSLRTKDAVTAAASQRLLEKAPGPAALLRLSQEEIARLAYPAGFYRTKAANLQKIAAILMDTCGGAVPSDMDALLALPGVGRKTANLVRTEAFDLDGLCVDTHVHRIANRCGWCGSEGSPSPNRTEMILREVLPKKYWKPINSLLVLYGQQICRPISPYCSRCVIRRPCPQQGVERSR